LVGVFGEGSGRAWAWTREKVGGRDAEGGRKTVSIAVENVEEWF
jgi:hypothetical protein